MAAFKLIILKSKFSHDIIPEHTHTHGHVYIFPFEHKHLQAFCLLANSHMINLEALPRKSRWAELPRNSGLWPLHRQPLSSCQQSLRQGKILQMEKQARALDALSQKILNNDSLEKPASSNSLLSDGAGPRDSTSLTPKALPAVPAVLPLPAPSVLHLLEDMMAPRQKPWGLWSWGQTHAHQEEGQWFGYCHEEASF